MNYQSKAFAKKKLTRRLVKLARKARLINVPTSQIARASKIGEGHKIGDRQYFGTNPAYQVMYGAGRIQQVIKVSKGVPFVLG